MGYINGVWYPDGGQDYFDYPYQTPGAGNIQQQLIAGTQSSDQMKLKASLAQALEEARWNRVMGFMGQSGMSDQLNMKGFGGQVSALASEAPMRGYQQAKRDVSNNMAARGMSLGTANDRSYGEAYGNLSRSLATAGTAGEVANKQMVFSLLGELLKMGGQTTSPGGF